MKIQHLLNPSCPWWVIGFFDNPLRRWFHNPETILAGLVREGQTALDIGCGMGYFTIQLARMVGDSGRVIAADLQPQMLAGLRKRAQKAELLSRIELHLAKPERIDVTEPIDFALTFWMLHEVRQQDAFLAEVYQLLKPGACLLLVEPLFHVSEKRFEQEIQKAKEEGFRIVSNPAVRFSRSALLMKEK